MTEMRILEILAENDCYPTDKRIAAMKQAVNEILDEAVDKAEAWISSNGEWTSSKVSARVDKQSILKLKVK